MPIRHSIIHQIDKKPDGTPAVLHVSGIELVESQATENLLHCRERSRLGKNQN